MMDLPAWLLNCTDFCTFWRCKGRADVLMNALEIFGLTPKAAKKTRVECGSILDEAGSRPERSSKNSFKRFSSM